MLYFMTQGHNSQTAENNYMQAYQPSVQGIKTEPDLHQVKMEPTMDYASGYYAEADDSTYDNGDMYGDEAGGMYTDPGGLYENTGYFADDTGQPAEYSQPQGHKVLLTSVSRG